MSEYRGDDFYCDRVLNGLELIKIEFETEHVLVYHHTRPTWDFHLVIVPKAHIANLCEVKDPALFAEIFSLITNVVVRYELNGTAYRIEALKENMDDGTIALWRNVQPMPEYKLVWRPTPEARTVRELLEELMITTDFTAEQLLTKKMPEMKWGGNRARREGSINWQAVTQR